MELEYITYEKNNSIGVVTLNRPEALNALSTPLVKDLGKALDDLEFDDNIKVIIITGSEKAFAAGADIKEMKDKNYPDTYKEDFITRGWERLSKFRKPVIAAVRGFALGGGNETVMMSDIVVAGESAKFGQPDVGLGIIPGAGGTQRLTRLIGKSRAMDLCLTGRLMSADEAEKAGLVSRLVADDKVMDEAMKIAEKISKMSLPVLMVIKESVIASQELSLSQGIMFERRMFQSTFAFEDQVEGMTAYVEKRKPDFKDN